MKAAVKAPSPTRRRSRFGILKAMMKASAERDAPRIWACRLSRTYPRTRETSVMKVMAPAERTSLRSSRIDRRQRVIGCGAGPAGCGSAHRGARVSGIEMMMRDGAGRDGTLITSSPLLRFLDRGVAYDSLR